MQPHEGRPRTVMDREQPRGRIAGQLHPKTAIMAARPVLEEKAAREKPGRPIGKQGANPGEHPDAAFVQAYPCPGCGNILKNDAATAGRRLRAQTYAGMGERESDPADAHGENHMAEVLIVRDMHKNGWETAHTVLSPGGQLELEVELPGASRTARGHPDGACRHPEFTKDKWVTMECKSMSVHKGLEVQDNGVAEVYPHYIGQISIYGLRLFEMGLVSHPERGVFAMMDRDGRPLPAERVKWDEDTTRMNIGRMAEAAVHAERGDAPGAALRPGVQGVRFLLIPHPLHWNARLVSCHAGTAPSLQASRVRSDSPHCRRTKRICFKSLPADSLPTNPDGKTNSGECFTRT